MSSTKLLFVVAMIALSSPCLGQFQLGDVSKHCQCLTPVEGPILKSEVDNIKYRKHKLSLKCMSNVTPKVYNNKFRGWGLTYWGD